MRALGREVDSIWLTDELRQRKPTVLDEVAYTLYYFDAVLFEAIPDLIEELHRAAAQANAPAPSFRRDDRAGPVRLVGGRRPGREPERHAGHHLEARSMTPARSLVLSKVSGARVDSARPGVLSESSRHCPVSESQPGELVDRDSSSSSARRSPELVVAGRAFDTEPYREKLRFVAERLERTRREA